MPVFPAASRPVTVMMFWPLCKLIFETNQSLVPDAVPEPPRLLDQVTCVTPTLSEDVPPIVIVLLEVE